MNHITAIGKDAAKLVGQLAAERDVDDGATRVLRDGDVKLDSVRAWQRTDPAKAIVHAADGSTVEAVYGAYRKPTKRQKFEAEGAKSAGVDLKKVVGRIVDVRVLEPKPGEKEGDVVILMTNGLRRTTKGGPPYRLLNISKGALYGISINGPLKNSPEELVELYEKSDVAPKPEEQSPETAPAPVPVAVPASGGVINVPSAPAPTAAPAEKKVRLKSKE